MQEGIVFPRARNGLGVLVAGRRPESHIGAVTLADQELVGREHVRDDVIGDRDRRPEIPDERRFPGVVRTVAAENLPDFVLKSRGSSPPDPLPQHPGQGPLGHDEPRRDDVFFQQAHQLGEVGGLPTDESIQFVTAGVAGEHMTFGRAIQRRRVHTFQTPPPGQDALPPG